MIKPPLLLAGLLCISALTACNHQSSKPSQSSTIAWQEYNQRSSEWQKRDREAIQTELSALGQEQATQPAYTKEFGFDPDQSIEWFKTDEGQRIADILLSFQTPSGGWSKRTDMATQSRRPGEAFGVEKKYIPTFDNSATSTQLELLAKAHTATGELAYADAFYKGFNLILDAQYPNGGWPQNYPLVGGYHNHITYNDGLMRDLMRLMHKVSQGKNEFAFVSEDARRKAETSLQRGIECVLNTQITVKGVRTIWGAQHDAKTLAPTKARAYEMTSLSTSESSSMLMFLMDIKNPSPKLVAAIHSAMAWYKENKITGYTWKRGDAAMTADAKAPPMWSRFVEIGTNRPIFGDRDGSIHYAVEEIAQERLKGYAWFTNEPNKALKKYHQWARKYPH